MPTRVQPIEGGRLPALREQIPALAKVANEKVAPWLAQYGFQLQLDPASIKAFVLKYLDANLEDWLATVLSRCSYLCDGIAVRDETTALRSGDTIDVLPPFAGG